MSEAKKIKVITIEQQLELAQFKIKDLQNEIIKIIEESKAHGQHLIDEPFIPEYLEFTDTVHFDADDARRVYYTLSGFNITRLQGNKWALVMPDSKTVSFNVENMLSGIIVLKALGVPVSVETVLNSTNDIDKFKEEIEAGLSKLKSEKNEEL